jgi:hypothetical protein
MAQTNISRNIILLFFLLATLVLFLERVKCYVKTSRKCKGGLQFSSDSYPSYFLEEKNFESNLTQHVGWFIVLIIISLIWWILNLSYVVHSLPENLLGSEWSDFVNSKVRPFSIYTSTMLIYWLINLTCSILFRWWRAKIVVRIRNRTLKTLTDKMK